MSNACRIVVIVQARMTSTRLPGKVLKKIAGTGMLSHQLRRIRKCSLVDEVVVATTTNQADDAIEELLQLENTTCFRGDEHDVLSRFVGAANTSHAGVVVRLTADCPLIDPQVIDRVIQELVSHADECDYASNILRRTYPRGLDVEAFFLDALLRFDRFGHTKADREHVTLLPRGERGSLFLSRSIEDEFNNSDLRWTVDTEADLNFIRTLFELLPLSERVVPYGEILECVRAHPEFSRSDSIAETWDPIR